jgi:hypothetical protein
MHPNVQEFDNLVKPDDVETDNQHSTTPPTFANDISAVIAHGTLPQQFYRLPKPCTTPITCSAPPQAKVTPNPQENRCIHIYLKATITNKANTPDFAGLMQVFDFLNYQVGLNGERPQIIVLPSKRKNGVENPIMTRWTNNQPSRQFYSLYFQGYVARKQPISAAEAKKKQKSAPTIPTAAPTTKTAGPSHILNVRLCVSINRPQLETLVLATTKTKHPPSCVIEVDPIRSEFVEKLGGSLHIWKECHTPNHHYLYMPLALFQILLV